MEGVHIMLDEIRTLKDDKASLEATIRIIDELMDEVLLLDNPEAMREIAMFIKEVIRE